MTSYNQFLKTKRIEDAPSGFAKIPDLNPMLFDFQRDIVAWALRRGRAAIFADCGMGKTPMQLEWARHIPGRVLILAPLAVTHQTIREGEKFGIAVNGCAWPHELTDGINITNYEKLDRFEPGDFEGIILDESSILKAYDGKTRTAIIETFKKTPYRLACTATPAPNDFMELGNHAEFLGVMTRTEMLSMFFIHDGGETQKWRLKGHAQSKFWKWICSWATMITAPSDLGYEDGDFVLPELRMHERSIATEPAEGMLFAMPAETLKDRLNARRSSISDRVACAAQIIKDNGKPNEPWMIWCNLNNESAALAKSIPDAVEATGSQTDEIKATLMAGFSQKTPRILVTKPRIGGFGMNWQHCSKVIFVGLSDSYEQYYQAVRRCWRFGQKSPVDCYIVTADTEGNVTENIKRKEADARKLAAGMLKNMSDINKDKIKGTKRERMTYKKSTTETDRFKIYLGDCVEVARKIPSDSIHYSIFSPPFASLYTYSNSERDMGNSANDDEFFQHYEFLIDELFRATMPGRLVSFHCMNLPMQKVRHGCIGIRDFRGECIRSFIERGFIYHSEVCIWKDPVTAMQRTKALGLLHKQLKKDACMSRMGIPDYVVTMRKPGENPERVTNTNGSFPVQVWQRYASPIWMDIRASKTLQYRAARENDDERHICPLQLDVIERCIRLWTNPGDTVLSPFAGIGSEGYVAIKMDRNFLGIELKESYYKLAVRNLRAAQEAAKQESLF